MNWLDKRHWQAKAANFLTDAFNRGWFSFAMSKRSETQQRETNYCYPSILANVQPETLERYASAIDIQSGFLSRFLIAHAPSQFVRAVTIDFKPYLEAAQHALDVFKSKNCIIRVDDGYLGDVFDTFKSHKAAYKNHWMRLVNEYGPRIAAMLSTQDDSVDTIEITEEAWIGAGQILYWYYSQAEKLLSMIQESENDSEWEMLLRSVYRAILSCGDNGASATDINRKVQRKRNKDRIEAIQELQSRGIIVGGKTIQNKTNKKTIYEIIDRMQNWEEN
jgi:hypothetical protein